MRLSPKNKGRAGILVYEHKGIRVSQSVQYGVVINNIDPYVLEYADRGWSSSMGLGIYWMLVWTSSGTRKGSATVSSKAASEK